MRAGGVVHVEHAVDHGLSGVGDLQLGQQRGNNGGGVTQLCEQLGMLADL
ncbi:MAG: hypothetical protein ACRDTA_02535 [Pseudonocardiaceae bacterium]